MPALRPLGSVLPRAVHPDLHYADCSFATCSLCAEKLVRNYDEFVHFEVLRMKYVFGKAKGCVPHSLLTARERWLAANC